MLAACGLLPVLLVTACDAQAPHSGTGTDAAGATAASAPGATVRVGRRDVQSVLTLKGDVQASPSVLMLSPGAGALQRSVDEAKSPALADGAGIATVAGQQVRMPAPGVVSRWLVPNGTTVRKGLPIAVVQTTGFAVRAQVPAADAYRLYSGGTAAQAAITGGPGPFPCALVQGDTAEQDSPTVMCIIPADVPAFMGVPALVAVHTGDSPDALVLPVTAVSGTAQQGRVSLVRADGGIEQVDVRLGISDGSYVEVTSGLEEGDVVTAHAPSISR